MWSPLSARADDRRRKRSALVGALLPADSPLSEADRRRGLRAKRAAVRSSWSSWPATRASTGWSRVAAPTFAEMFDDAARCALTGCAPLPRDAGDLRPADGARAHLRRVRGRAREAVARGDAPLLPLHSQQRLVGARRDLSRSDPRGACRADRPRRRAPDPRPHGAGARREAKRRLRGAVRALPRRRRRARTRRFRPVLPPTKAGAALAFDRAAFFYRHALALTPASSAARAWKEGLANALANAGRPAEAAEAYLRAAAGAGHPQRVELQRRGAEQFLIGGHIDRGLDLIRTMLAGMGMRVPRSPRAALLSLLWRRARLRWRGLRFVPRPVDEIDADTLLRVDTCWSATTGLLLVDMISAVGFQRASPAHGARCRRTVPYRSRDGDRVGGQGRVSDAAER